MLSTSYCILVSLVSLLGWAGHCYAAGGLNAADISGDLERPKFIYISTQYGAIRVKPLYDVAPKTVDLILALARTGKCESCYFYRHEEAAYGAGHNDFYGPPYGLLQGRMSALTEVPPREGAPLLKKGHIAFLPGTKDFFIAKVDHPEWQDVHTVWGLVEGELYFNIMEDVPYEPMTTRTDENGVTTKWLLKSGFTNFDLRMLETTL